MGSSLHFILAKRLKEIRKNILRGKEFYLKQKKKNLCLGMLISENLLLLEFMVDLYCERPEISKKEAETIRKELLEIYKIFSDIKRGPKIKSILEKIEKVAFLLSSLLIY